jgi:hypothetical protein
MEGASMRAKYIIMEVSGAGEVIQAENLEAALEAAKQWSADGDYDERTMVTCYAQELDDDGYPVGERLYADVEAGPEPAEPDCKHDWQSPHDIVGGHHRKNPGVLSKGGTLITCLECCALCGAYRRTYHTGSGELREVIKYDEADERSLKWIASGEQMDKTQFVEMVAGFTPDGWCRTHSHDAHGCVGCCHPADAHGSCDVYEQDADDALDTLQSLIRQARNVLAAT